eukprot:scaffold3027_cov31-Tisochrysis_lutea.AAC.7
MPPARDCSSLVAKDSRTHRLVTPHGPPIPLAHVLTLCLCSCWCWSIVRPCASSTNFLRYDARHPK